MASDQRSIYYRILFPKSADSTSINVSWKQQPLSVLVPWHLAFRGIMLLNMKVYLPIRVFSLSQVMLTEHQVSYLFDSRHLDVLIVMQWCVWRVHVITKSSHCYFITIVEYHGYCYTSQGRNILRRKAGRSTTEAIKQAFILMKLRGKCIRNTTLRGFGGLKLVWIPAETDC